MIPPAFDLPKGGQSFPPVRLTVLQAGEMIGAQKNRGAAAVPIFIVSYLPFLPDQPREARISAQ